MAKVKLELPDAFLFETEIVVRITDINYGGHLGNDTLLSLLHESRARLFRHMGFDERDIEGSSVIMTDAELVFSSEAFDGEWLAIRLQPVLEGRTRCEIFYQVSNAADGREVARARTGMVFFDYTDRKIKKTPAGFRHFIEHP
jgi:acyl-CoA thioesterase FadM